MMEYMPVFALVPQPSLRLRALHTRDLHGVVWSAIVFADGGQNEDEESLRAINRAVNRTRTRAWRR